ncbi:hypothetical protein [Spirosoma profusum]|nr:hypothetical protein [Spirosoma profusum]
MFTTRIIGFLAAGLITIASCKSGDSLSNDQVPPADKVSLGLDQSARIGSQIVVRVESIQDSRCPANVTCVWAGQAKVQVNLSKDTDSKTVQLILGQDLQNKENKRPDSTGVTLANEVYKVVLREVSPYPETTQTTEPKKAVVQVTKL